MNTIDTIREIVSDALLNDRFVMNTDRARWQEVRKLLDRLEGQNGIVVNITGLITEDEFEKRVLEVVKNALK